MPPIRVLVVEDSPTQRYQLVSLIQQAPDMVVIGQARDGLEAIQLVEKLRPDVISMDLRMPNLSGLDATRHIMDVHPTPIVIVSSASSDADLTMQAMQAGALAALEKPPAVDHPDFKARCAELLSALRLMSGVRVIRHWQSVPAGGMLPALRPTGPLLAPVMPNTTTPEVVAIGASAGGPSALAELFGRLPYDFNLPIVAVQHLTADFMPGLAEWLDRVCALPVRLAQNGEKLTPGVALLAPGDQHLRIGADRRIVLDSERGSYRHQPAVDVLLTSVAQRFGANAVGILLTGMGDDGASGLKAMRDSGARTIAQDESSCVVFGMPGAAIALDAAEFILPLDKIASAIFKLSQRGEDRK